MMDQVMDPAAKTFPCPEVVETPLVKAITNRALSYLQCGFPVHFSGLAGTGKTTLALYVAARRERPVLFLHGDERLTSTDLVGGLYGYLRHKLVDNFIHSVLKLDEEMMLRWMDSWLAVACKNGYTLVYDEFTRSRPEANNVLLSVLEEGILTLPGARGQEEFIKVHPDFRALFTSNPVEYAGTFVAPDALRDRLLTIRLTYYDEASEVAITRARSGLPVEEAGKIVKVVRAARERLEGKDKPSLRACIAIARLVGYYGVRTDPASEEFLRICLDVLGLEPEKEAALAELVAGAIGRNGRGVEANGG